MEQSQNRPQGQNRLSDKELMERFLGGEVEGFNLLVQNGHQDLLLAGEITVQGAFTQVYGGRDIFNGGSLISAAGK